MTVGRSLLTLLTQTAKSCLNSSGSVVRELATEVLIALICYGSCHIKRMKPVKEWNSHCVCSGAGN